MGIITHNVSSAVSLSLTALRVCGFWAPQNLTGTKKLLYHLYGFITFLIILGIFVINQMVDLYLIWGNLPMMTATAFLLFTNFAHSTKILNIVVRRDNIQRIINDADSTLREETGLQGREIVKSCDQVTRWQQLLFFIITFLTITGWASSAEKNKLPLQAWYPYDTSKSPAYEITYIQQVLPLMIGALLNVSKDTLTTTLIAQCRCRLRLVGLSLRNLCNELHPVGGEVPKKKSLVPSLKSLMLTKEQEMVVMKRLRYCVIQHQRALEAAGQLQLCFSEPVFAQLTVSLVIICVTAFQLTAQTGNPIRLLSMGTYLLNMMLQVFLYCYQGNQLSVESDEVADAAYEMPWYTCSMSIRRTIIILMRRCRRTTKITAGGFTTLSLAAFMAVIKTSYSMFTLLQQVDSKN